MRRVTLIFVVSSVLLAGCNTLSLKERERIFTAENDSFVGKSYDELLKGKGVPTGTATLSDSGKVVEYYNAQIESSGGGVYDYPTTHYIGNANGTGTWIYSDHMWSIPAQSWSKICKIDFILSPKNIVESWKYDGKGCF